MKPTLNNDALPISSEINGILIKYCSALAEITKLNNDNARLREEIARLREALNQIARLREIREQDRIAFDDLRERSHKAHKLLPKH